VRSAERSRCHCVPDLPRPLPATGQDQPGRDISRTDAVHVTFPLIRVPGSWPGAGLTVTLQGKAAGEVRDHRRSRGTRPQRSRPPTGLRPRRGRPPTQPRGSVVHPTRPPAQVRGVRRTGDNTREARTVGGRRAARAGNGAPTGLPPDHTDPMTPEQQKRTRHDPNFRLPMAAPTTMNTRDYGSCTRRSQVSVGYGCRRSRSQPKPRIMSTTTAEPAAAPSPNTHDHEIPP
jgi:hypothetical protein